MIDIWIAFLFCRGNIIYLAFNSYFDIHYVGFRNYFTLSAYLNVFRVFSEHAEEGATFPIITVLQKPTNESFSTIVNFEPRKGVWPFPWSKALIHSFKESKDLLIYAPSIRVCFFISVWSAPLSFPARSMKEILPKTFFPSLREIWRIACDLDDSALAEFCEVILCVLPYSNNWANWSMEVIWIS